jgi:hypothetical protein
MFFLYLLSIHEPLLLRQIQDLHGHVQLGARLVRDAAVIVADHATFPASHLKASRKKTIRTPHLIPPDFINRDY